MWPFSLPPGAAFPGEIARRRAILFLLFAVVVTPLTVWLFRDLPLLWGLVISLEGQFSVTLGSVAVGAARAAAPVFTLAGWLLALWFGVQSVYAPRARKTPVIDRLIIGVGLLAWFAPAAAFLATAIWSLISGKVHFPQPARDFLRAEDPVAYWQSLGFLFLAAALFAWLAWQFWRGKLRRDA
jgi:hypothetical protein